MFNAKEARVGDTRMLVLVEGLTRRQIALYAEGSGDKNPLHIDEDFARNVAGYPEVFAQGMLTMGMTGRVLTDWVGPARLTRYEGRIVSQVWPGDTLTAHAAIAAVREVDGKPLLDLSVVTLNQHGERVFLGTAGAHLT